MKSIYTRKIEEESLSHYLTQVNMSDRDKELIRTHLEGNITYRELGELYEITGERVRQLVEKFARKAHHLYKKDYTIGDIKQSNQKIGE